jgi:hypothetical protein
MYVIPFISHFFIHILEYHQFDRTFKKNFVKNLLLWPRYLWSRNRNRNCNLSKVGLQAIVVIYKVDERESTKLQQNTLDHRLNMELDLPRLFGLHVHSCTHLPPPPIPPAFWAHITRALLVTQNRRHLFVTPSPGLTSSLCINAFHLRLKEILQAAPKNGILLGLDADNRPVR